MVNLFHISAAVRLGLHATLLLAQEPNRRRSIAELAETLKVSANHLAKVLTQLERNGLLNSRTGPGGGYILTRQPRAINLLAIYQALEVRLPVNHCPFFLPFCNGDRCPLGGFFKNTNQQVVAKLKNTTLADIKIKIGGKDEVKKKDNQN